MKNKILFNSFVLSALVVSVTAQTEDSRVLMTVGKSPVTVSEFQNVFKKNAPKDSKVDKKSLDEYVDLYINFRLKVKEAEELGLDTVKSFKDELLGYRKQLTQPYLTDKDVNDKLLKESYDRMGWEVKASHILVKLSETALPKDTLEAYNKIMKFRARILKGEDFNKVAKEKGVSDDQSAADNGGDLGYFSSMQMVYPFESAAYNTKVGDISMPVRTRYGYHIIKVQDRRKASGEIIVAHIMVKSNDKVKPEEAELAKAKAEEAYKKAKAGEDFAALVSQYSDDKNSAKKVGELDAFSMGSALPEEFKSAAFSLKNDGDISAPVKTTYGWHIIKKMKMKQLASFEDMKSELKAKVSRDSRSQMGRTALIAKVKKENKFKETSKLVDELTPFIDSTFFEGKWSANKAAKLNKVLFTLGDKNYTQADFAKYLEQRQTKRAKVDVKPLLSSSYKQYVDETCVNLEDSQLEKKYPEFRALLQEYRDGILLFNLTDQKVWSKAVKDSAGLKVFYENNKNNYMWQDRAVLAEYTCANEKTATAVKKMIAKKVSEKEIAAKFNKTEKDNVVIETTLAQKGENKVADENWTKAGVPTANNAKEGKKVSFFVVAEIKKPVPKALEDCKGLATADYQSYLEKTWIQSLKNKYAVSVNKDVLNTLQ